ncbi:MAG: hypothetical protein HOH58_07720 [Opitutaceae bacterium]|jgi:hypothetical protein|nr:hypothetical protein [Opitutaceae bacterium]
MRPPRHRHWQILLLLPALGMRLALAQSEPPSSTDEPVLSLPPFVVDHDDRRTRTWRFVSLPEVDFELLTDVDSQQARDFASNYFRQEQLLNQLIPERFLWRSDQPKRHLLIADPGGSAIRDSTMNALFGNIKNSGKKTGMRLMPNIRLDDGETSMVYAYSRQQTPDALVRLTLYGRSEINFSFLTNRIRFLLARRTPALPHWFVEGLSGVYDTSEFSQDDIEIGPVLWISGSEADALRRNSNRPRQLLPLSRLFSTLTTDQSVASREAWIRQCTLFVRWAMFAEEGRYRDALWKFVDGTVTGGASDSFFRECFGFSFADGRDILSDYLATATNDDHRIAPRRLPRTPRFQVRRATPEEIWFGRLEWSRLAFICADQHFPELRDAYLKNARNTGRLAQQETTDSARIQLSLGLLEFNAKNLKTALPLLEQATARVPGSASVYYAIAACRYQAAHAALPADTKFSIDQTGEILANLDLARRQRMPMARVYTLLGNLWLNSELTPSASDLEELSEGIDLFPSVARISLSVALLHAELGQIDRALEVVYIGLQNSRSQQDIAQFYRLEETLLDQLALLSDG